MIITIITTLGCRQCRLVEKLLDKYEMDYDIEEHKEMTLDDYPRIYINRKKYDYLEFLKFVRNDGLNEVK